MIDVLKFLSSSDVASLCAKHNVRLSTLCAFAQIESGFSHCLARSDARDIGFMQLNKLYHPYSNRDEPGHINYASVCSDFDALLRYTDRALEVIASCNAQVPAKCRMRRDVFAYAVYNYGSSAVRRFADTTEQQLCAVNANYTRVIKILDGWC